MRQAPRKHVAVSTAALCKSSPSPPEDSPVPPLVKVYAPQDRVHHKGAVPAADAGAVASGRPARARRRPWLRAAQGPASPPVHHKVLFLCSFVTMALCFRQTGDKAGSATPQGQAVDHGKGWEHPYAAWGQSVELPWNTHGPFASCSVITESTGCCREAALAYWGLCLHIGRPLPQNRHGHLLGHVKNTALDQHHPDTRIYATARAQPCDRSRMLTVIQTRRKQRSH